MSSMRRFRFARLSLLLCLLSGLAVTGCATGVRSEPAEVLSLQLPFEKGFEPAVGPEPAAAQAHPQALQQDEGRRAVHLANTSAIWLARAVLNNAQGAMSVFVKVEGDGRVELGQRVPAAASGRSASASGPGSPRRANPRPNRSRGPCSGWC